MITTNFMNESLGTHEDHLISFIRHRQTDGFKDQEGDQVPTPAGASQKVTLTLTCLDCHTGFLIAIEDDTGQDIDP